MCKGFCAKDYPKNKSKHPDPKLHQRISFVKSGLRIFAGAFLMYTVLEGAVILNCIFVAGLLFVIAEVIGVIEELV